MLKRKFTVLALVLILFIVFWLFISGYRLTGQSAAKSNGFITKSYHLFASYKTGYFGIFLFKSNEKKMYRTVLSERTGFFYRSNISTYIPYRSGALETVGYMNVASPSEFTFMSFKSNSSSVAYIEAGTKPNRRRKTIKDGQTIFFLFHKYISLPIVQAFDSQGKELYYYGYRKNTNIFTNFKWHKYKPRG